MKFAMMRKIAWAGVVLGLIFAVACCCVSLIYYLPQAHYTTGFTRIKYPITGFWWSMLALSWTLLLVVPYLTYFLRANGWCAACCGGHQQYHLSSLFISVVDEDYGVDKPIHPGKKRPLLSNKAKMVLHIIMLMVGCAIVITSLLCFLCFAGILGDTAGAAWALITTLVGISFLAVIAFVFKQLRVRDHKRNLLATSPSTIRRVVSDSEERIGKRWERGGAFSDLERESDEEGIMSDSDTRHLLRHELSPDQVRRTLNGEQLSDEEGGSSGSDDDGLVEEDEHQQLQFGHAQIQGEDARALAEEDEADLLDLDENILASQLSGHSPFSLSQQVPDSSWNTVAWRIFAILSLFLLALLIIVLFVFQILATYQTISMAVDAHLVPPAGQFYSGSDSYGYRIHMDCRGKASTFYTPTILIESDWASVSYEWTLVTKYLLTEAGNSFRVCTYDRAGYGWSDPGQKPRDARRAARELETVLRNARELGPLVLVSNGYGAFVSRVFAKATSHLIMAVILVDGLHEDTENDVFRALGMSVNRGNALHNSETASLFSKKLLAPIGIPRLQLKLASQLTGIEQRKELASKGQLSYSDAVWSEFDNMFGLSQQEVLQAQSDAFGNTPLTVVVSEWRINGTCAQNQIPQKRCAKFLDMRQKLGDIPMKLQQDLLELSSKSKLVLAKDSFKPYLDQPLWLSKLIVQSAREAANITVSNGPF